MKRSPLIAVLAAGFWLAAALLLFFAVLVLPAYTAFMVIWIRVPLLDVLAFTGPVAALSLLLAAGAIWAARRKVRVAQ